MDRWPTFHKPGLRWVGCVERALGAYDHPDHGAFIAITSAIEYQFENGADPDTVRLLMSALAQFASSCGISPQAIGLDGDPATMITKLAPRRAPAR